MCAVNATAHCRSTLSMKLLSPESLSTISSVNYLWESIDWAPRVCACSFGDSSSCFVHSVLVANDISVLNDI